MPDPSTSASAASPAAEEPVLQPAPPEARPWAGKGVLVTGGAGFIGSHLVDRLVAEGCGVRVLDDLSGGRLENLASVRQKVDFLRGDVRRRKDCQRAVDGVDLVFHQAALGSVPRSMKDPATSLEVNVTGTANLLAAVRDAGLRHVVYASSSSVYGDDPRLPKIEGREGRPLSPYSLSKVMDEQLADVFARCFGLRLAGLRYFNVFGPRQNPEGDYAAVIPRFFTAGRQGRPMTIHGDGEQSRDFTYVADAVEANLRAAAALMLTPEGPDRALSGISRVYNVGGGASCTVARLAGLVRDLTGGPQPVHEEARPGDVRASLADLGRIRRELGYQPVYDLEAGLEAARRYYLEPASSAGRP